MVAAFSRAREAWRAWAALSVRRRAAVLLDFHDILPDGQAEAMDLIQVETGKARLHAQSCRRGRQSAALGRQPEAQASSGARDS
ncbi:aldehyde dehydrogenase family protein [Streptomyces sp. NPDC008092]|uniref:aldehyde dehydrogenase family protein n=1 Tax=Streptomyces sp. NPDC008092 TaxID=3364808 RepID=UPI0036F0A4D0